MLLKEFDGQVRIECFHDGSGIDLLMRDVEAIARTSYQRGLGMGFFYNERMRQRLALEAEKGWLRAHILYVRDKPCAFWVASQYNNVVSSDMMGHNPEEYSKASPGMFLILKVIDEFYSGLRPTQTLIIDFGRTEQEYKRRLGNISWREASLYIFAPTVSGVCVNFLRTVPARAVMTAKRLMLRSGAIVRMRREWARRAVK